MIFAKCPLRISLAGGGTDLESFISRNPYGHVVSFSCDLYTYVSIHRNNRNKYIVNYSKPEEADDPSKIKNDIVREVLKDRCAEPMTITFNSDIFSSGSGLASSSSFTLSLLKAFSTFSNDNLSEFSLCEKALAIERKFNNLTGRQDPYGCGIGGLKSMKFYKDKASPVFSFLPTDIFGALSMFLLPTNIIRNSKDILERTSNSNLSPFLNLASQLERALLDSDLNEFLNIINEGWESKKNETPHVVQSTALENIDRDLKSNPKILAHRLCGAGSGGYFLCICERNFALKSAIPVNIINHGMKSYSL